jgi:hypothetical protein
VPSPRDIRRAVRTHRERQEKADEALRARDGVLRAARDEGWGLDELAALAGISRQAVTKAIRPKGQS